MEDAPDSDEESVKTYQTRGHSPIPTTYGRSSLVNEKSSKFTRDRQRCIK